MVHQLRHGRLIGLGPHGDERRYCHSFLRQYFGQGADVVAAVGEAGAKALHLDPNLPEAHASRGLALFLSHDYAQADLRRAIDLDPRLYDSHHIFGRMCFWQGHIVEAAEHFCDACTIVLEADDAWHLLGMCYRRPGESGRAWPACPRRSSCSMPYTQY